MDSADKKRVNELIPTAKKALEACGVAVHGKVKKAWRGQVSAFGAAIVTGSLQAAVAMYSKQGNADVDRPKLLRAIEQTLGLANGDLNTQVGAAAAAGNSLKLRSLQREITNAAVALKLAMNLFELTKEQGDADE